MTKTQEVLNRINILVYQLAEGVERGDTEFGWVKDTTDDIENLIKEIKD